MISYHLLRFYTEYEPFKMMHFIKMWKTFLFHFCERQSEIGHATMTTNFNTKIKACVNVLPNIMDKTNTKNLNLLKWK